MNNKRIQWIDALKGFGIFCVTLGHLSPFYPLEKHIYSFHMFLFFFISGYLFKQRDSLKTFIKKRFKSIFIPFLVWDLLSSLVAIPLGEEINSIVSKFFIINGRLCWNAPIWFLFILFIVEILFAIIMKYSKFRKTSLIVLIVSIILWILIGSCSYLPLKLNLVPFALFFYTLGNMFNISKTKISSRNLNIVVSLLGIVSILFGCLLNIRISYTMGAFGNIYYCIIAAIAGTIFYFFIFKNFHLLGENKILIKLGKNSLIIMVTQYWFFKFFDILSQKLFNVSVWQMYGTLKAIIVSIITISFILVGVSIFKKIFKNNEKILLWGKYLGIQ